MEKIEGKNWIHRRLIQREVAIRRGVPLELPLPGEDPLMPAKRRYFQMYAEEIGQPLESLSTTPPHSIRLNHIAEFVESTAAQADSLHDSGRAIVMEFAESIKGVTEDDLFQYLNKTMSITGRNLETVLELTTRWFANPTPVRSRSQRIWRKLISRGQALDYQDRMDELDVQHARELQMASHEFKESLRRKGIL